MCCCFELCASKPQILAGLAVCCVRSTPCKRGVYHMLLLGQGGSGKTYVAKLIFPVVLFIWPPEDGLDTLRAVAAKTSQAKNTSTAAVTATTLHSAACTRVQKLANPKTSAGAKESKLIRNWESCRARIMEEISTISALLFNMLDHRSMLGHRRSHHLSPDEYHKTGNAFGRIPIALHLGDFLELHPTGQLSVVTNLEEKDDDGNYVYNDAPLEVAHAQKVFGRAHDVFELRGTMRFVPGDPLVELLQRMRAGLPFPEEVWTTVWTAFQARCVSADQDGASDERLLQENFRSGYGTSIHWNMLTRMMNRRTILDDGRSQVPLDECMTMDTDGCQTSQHWLHAWGIPLSRGHGDSFFGEGGRQEAWRRTQWLRFWISSFMNRTERSTSGLAQESLSVLGNYLPSGLYLSIRGYHGSENWKDYTHIVEKRGFSSGRLSKLWSLFGHPKY